MGEEGGRETPIPDMGVIPIILLDTHTGPGYNKSMSRPQKYTVQIRVCLTPEFDAWAEEQAKTLAMPKSGFIRMLIAQARAFGYARSSMEALYPETAKAPTEQGAGA